jgi:hypothetical protein
MAGITALRAREKCVDFTRNGQLGETQSIRKMIGSEERKQNTLM